MMPSSSPSFAGDLAAWPAGHVVPRRVDGGRFRVRQWFMVFVPFVATLMRVASPPTSAAAYVLVALWALTGRRQAIVALFLCWLFNCGNHSFCGPPLMAGLLRYVVYFAAAASVFARGPGRTPTMRLGGLLWGTIGLFALLLAHAVVFAKVTDIAILKTLSFEVVFLTALCGWAWMNPEERHRTFQILVGGLVLTMIASILYVPTGRAYFRHSRLVAGVLQHSQILGVAAGQTAAILLFQCLAARPFRWWRVAALGAACLCVYWSGARVGLLAFLGAVAIGIVYETLSGVVSRTNKNPRIVTARIAVAAALLLLPSIAAGPALLRAASRFVVKDRVSEAEINLDSLEDSASGRIEKINTMQANIARHPVEGIGFGVASNAENFTQVARDPVFGLPLIASVEKGVMPVMVLEELGIPLGSLVFVWLIALGVACTRGGLQTVMVFASVMLANLAEAAFFSPGGMGLLSILLVTWAATEPAGGTWKRHLLDRQKSVARAAAATPPLSPVQLAPRGPALPRPPAAPALPAATV